MASNTMMNEILIGKEEIEILCEIGYAGMQACAEALSVMLGRGVAIESPACAVATFSSDDSGDLPYVIVDAKLSGGVTGKNTYVFLQEDAKTITDLMLGMADGTKDSGLDDTHLNAIVEAMHQMTDAAAAAMGQLLNADVAMSGLNAVYSPLSEADSFLGMRDANSELVQIEYMFKVEGVIESSLYQFMPKALARQLADAVTELRRKESEADAAEVAFSRTPDVKPLHLNDLGAADTENGIGPDNGIEMILDVPLQISVELGRCRKTISEILGLNMGSIIMLDKVAGEPVDVVVNGKPVAKGEVVVIDDNYGIRITEVNSVKRLSQSLMTGKESGPAYE